MPMSCRCAGNWSLSPRRWSPRHATDEQRGALMNCARTMTNCAVNGDLAAFFAADKAFDELLEEACPNTYITAALGPVQTHSTPSLVFERPTPDRMDRSIKLHVTVIRAIQPGQGGRIAAGNGGLDRLSQPQMKTAPSPEPFASIIQKPSADEGAFDDELGRLAVGAFFKACLFEQFLSVLQHGGRAADHAAVDCRVERRNAKIGKELTGGDQVGDATADIRNPRG